MGASQSCPARASAGELLGTKARQGSTARAPAEAARPGWRQPSHLGEVVAAGAWPKDPASSTAQKGMRRMPLSAQLSPWLHRPAPLFCKRLHHITPRQEHTAPWRGMSVAAGCQHTTLSQSPGSRAPLPPHGPAKTPRGTSAKAASAPAQPASPCPSACPLPQNSPLSLTQPACCMQASSRNFAPS